MIGCQPWFQQVSGLSNLDQFCIASVLTVRIDHLNVPPRQRGQKDHVAHAKAQGGWYAIRKHWKIGVRLRCDPDFGGCGGGPRPLIGSELPTHWRIYLDQR